MTTGEVRKAVNFIPGSSHSKDTQQRQENRGPGDGQEMCTDFEPPPQLLFISHDDVCALNEQKT
jgi:hypothetical protein